ncbi:uncharacterized protein LOC129240606 [Anastrepha obliqua]|uniref:uncharacterized protein LOC129240606 n=1 Tax=Anastrepha obliqua TaxID=95512 RepID=UPI0024093A67|nr:uncharacterized protein LOC129240606 [Anastrepha obliqua]
MYARVLRKWSLNTKLQMSIVMWRLLLLTLLLLCLCASPATCNTTNTNSNTTTLMHVSRSVRAPAYAFATASASAITANVPATVTATNRAAAAAARQSVSLPHSLTAPAAETVGDIIEESYYIPVDGDDVDSNIYDSRLVQALDVGNVLMGRRSAGAEGNMGSSKKRLHSSNSYRSGGSGSGSSSRIFSSSSVVSNSDSSKSRKQQQQQQQQQHEKEQLSQQASGTYADNLAYAHYRRAVPATFNSSSSMQSATETTTTATTALLAVAPQTVFSPQFSVQHVANDENVAADDDDVDDVDGDDNDEEEVAEVAKAMADEEDEELALDVDNEDDGDADMEDGDVNEHASNDDDAADEGRQQQKVPNKKNSHITNLFKAYKLNNNNPYSRKWNMNMPHLQPQPLQQQLQQNTAVNPHSHGAQQYESGRRSSKARRHVTAEQRQHWLSQQQQQQKQDTEPLLAPGVAHTVPHSSTSTQIPIMQYPTKKVFQLVNGKNLTRIVHLWPATHYRIAAYEIPSSLPNRGGLTEQQRRMLQHQREQQQLQLQQDQAARSRRDSHIFGSSQGVDGKFSSGFYSGSTLGQQTNSQQHFQRLQQSNSASSSSWQQISGNIFQRQQPFQQQHTHKHQHNNGDSNNYYRNHNRNNSNNNNNRKHNQRQRAHKRSRRYCSARDPAQLAFEAPIVFEGKITSMSPDRRHNFAATVQVLNAYKQQIGYQVKREQFVRLQFAYINSSGECDIYREQLRPRGLVPGEELELQRTYLFFVQQVDLRNFTILGQPIRRTRRVVEAVKDAVSENYAENGSQTAEVLNGVYGADAVTASYVEFRCRRFRSGVFGAKENVENAESVENDESVDKITE